MTPRGVNDCYTLLTRCSAESEALSVVEFVKPTISRYRQWSSWGRTRSGKGDVRSPRPPLQTGERWDLAQEVVTVWCIPGALGKPTLTRTTFQAGEGLLGDLVTYHNNYSEWRITSRNESRIIMTTNFGSGISLFSSNKTVKIDTRNQIFFLRKCLTTIFYEDAFV